MDFLIYTILLLVCLLAFLISAFSESDTFLARFTMLFSFLGLAGMTFVMLLILSKEGMLAGIITMVGIIQKFFS